MCRQYLFLFIKLFPTLISVFVRLETRKFGRMIFKLSFEFSGVLYSDKTIIGYIPTAIEFFKTGFSRNHFFFIFSDNSVCDSFVFESFFACSVFVFDNGKFSITSAHNL